jgi:putative endonuclease
MFFVYLLASEPYGTLYIGLTTNLSRRVWEHKNKLVPGFTAKYGVDRLVWFEIIDDREAALRREKQLKEWKRDWKINLIESNNRHWVDLYQDLPTRQRLANGSRPSPGWCFWRSEAPHDRTRVPR